MADIWDGNPKTWVPGGALVASEYNTEFRDRFTYLYNRLPAPNMKEFPDDGTLPTAFVSDATYGWDGSVPGGTPLYVTQGNKRWISIDSGTSWQLTAPHLQYEAFTDVTYTGSGTTNSIQSLLDQSLTCPSGRIRVEVTGWALNTNFERSTHFIFRVDSAIKQRHLKNTSSGSDFVEIGFSYSLERAVGTAVNLEGEVLFDGTPDYDVRVAITTKVWDI